MVETIEQVWEEVAQSMNKSVKKYTDSRNNLIKEFGVSATKYTNVLDKTHLFWRTSTYIYESVDEYNIEVYTSPDLAMLGETRYDGDGVSHDEEYSFGFILNPEKEKFEDQSGIIALHIDVEPAEVWLLSKQLRQTSFPDAVFP